MTNVKKEDLRISHREKKNDDGLMKVQRKVVVRMSVGNQSHMFGVVMGTPQLSGNLQLSHLLITFKG